MSDSTASLHIGPVAVSPPLVLAPMAGVTSAPFRRICRELGAGLVCGEMVSANALRYDSLRSARMLRVAPEERPVSLQIAAGDPEVAAEAVRRAVLAGADIVDINFGCPVPKVRKSGAGAILLRDAGRARAILEAAVDSAGGVPVTVKLRAGWSDADLPYLDYARMACEVGCAAVALHARTALQMYRGQAHWPWIAELARECPLPVLGNGDVRSGEDAVRMLEETGCAAVMVGRAARDYPWIFREAVALLAGAEPPPAPSWIERLALAERLCAGLVESHGPQVGALVSRTALSGLSRGLPDGARFRERAHGVGSLEEIRALIREYTLALRERGGGQSRGAAE